MAVMIAAFLPVFYLALYGFSASLYLSFKLKWISLADAFAFGVLLITGSLPAHLGDFNRTTDTAGCFC